MKGRLLSPGFVCALFGIAVTILGFADIWLWPAWPAIAVLELLFGPPFKWVDLSYEVRAAIVVGLIALNIAVWALSVRLAWWLWLRFRISGTGARSAPLP